VRFSLIRLSDNLPLTAFKVALLAVEQSLRWSYRDVLPVLLALAGMHRHVPPRSARLKPRSFPPVEFCCLDHPWYYDLLRLLIPHPPGLRTMPYTSGYRDEAPDSMQSPLFHRLLGQHSAPPTPESSSGLHFQMLHPFHGLRLGLRGSALSCPLQVNISTLQDSRHVTDCCLAPLPQRDTPLQHPRSPWSTGRLLRGVLALTTPGLAPGSRR